MTKVSVIKIGIALLYTNIYLWLPPNLNLMADKKIRLNFFQLNPRHESADPQEATKQGEAIEKIFNVLPEKFNPVVLTDHTINFFAPPEKKGGYFLGTLIKSQTFNIPPSWDEANAIMAKLPLNDGQHLAFQTSFLYDPSYRIIMIQSVQNAVGINTFCFLLNQNFTGISTLEPSLIINPEKLKEFNDMTVIRNFQVKVAKIENGSIFNTNKRTALGQVMSSADDTNTETLEYALSVRKHDKTLKRSRIRSLVRSLLRYEESKELKKLVVIGKEDEDSESVTINFIEERLKDYIYVKTQRLIESFDINDHYDKMVNIYDSHKSSLSVYKVKSHK